MADNNDSLLREVDEELRREQLAKLWERYGTYILALAVAFVALVGGYKVWEARQIEFAQAGGKKYNEARSLLASGKTDDALKAFDELIASGHAGYSALALLQKAGADITANKPKEALAILEKAEQEAGSDPILKGFIQLQIASLKLGEADFTEIQNRLTELASEGNPWRHSARELIGLAALKAGKTDEAAKAFEAILADRKAPQNIADRARVMMGSITSAAMSKAADVPAPAPAPAGAASGETTSSGAGAPTVAPEK
jgi:hypothetical protein